VVSWNRTTALRRQIADSAQTSDVIAPLSHCFTDICTEACRRGIVFDLIDAECSLANAACTSLAALTEAQMRLSTDDLVEAPS
jgi:hypothetical protein